MTGMLVVVTAMMLPLRHPEISPLMGLFGPLLSNHRNVGLHPSAYGPQGVSSWSARSASPTQSGFPEQSQSVGMQDQDAGLAQLHQRSSPLALARLVRDFDDLLSQQLCGASNGYLGDQRALSLGISPCSSSAAALGAKHII